MSTLIAVPNCSEGRDAAAIAAIAAGFGGGLLDVHTDPDHNRSVFTIAGEPGLLSEAVCAGAGAAIEQIDVGIQTGIHPRVGAIDVAPIVYLEPEDRGAACAEALVLGDRLGHELALPVFLYGELAGGRTRAELRKGGTAELARRVAAGELTPDFGPRRALHPTAGAVLVAARPPLLAFNVELAPPATLELAQQVAATIREGGSAGLAGVRALGLWLEHRSVAQVSMNIENHRALTLADVVQAIARQAPIAAAEVVGLPPAAAYAGFPEELPVRHRRVLEEALADASRRAH